MRFTSGAQLYAHGRTGGVLRVGSSPIAVDAVGASAGHAGKVLIVSMERAITVPATYCGDNEPVPFEYIPF